MWTTGFGGGLAAVLCRWGVVRGCGFRCGWWMWLGGWLSRRVSRPGAWGAVHLDHRVGRAWPSGVMSSRLHFADAAGAAGASASSARGRRMWLGNLLSHRVSRLAARGSHLDHRGAFGCRVGWVGRPSGEGCSAIGRRGDADATGAPRRSEGRPWPMGLQSEGGTHLCDGLAVARDVRHLDAFVAANHVRQGRKLDQ